MHYMATVSYKVFSDDDLILDSEFVLVVRALAKMRAQSESWFDQFLKIMCDLCLTVFIVVQLCCVLQKKTRKGNVLAYPYVFHFCTICGVERL